jgi:hypothetical protein
MIKENLVSLQNCCKRPPRTYVDDEEEEEESYNDDMWFILEAIELEIFPLELAVFTGDK